MQIARATQSSKHETFLNEEPQGKVQTADSGEHVRLTAIETYRPSSPRLPDRAGYLHFQPSKIVGITADHTVAHPGEVLQYALPTMGLGSAGNSVFADELDNGAESIRRMEAVRTA